MSEEKLKGLFEGCVAVDVPRKRKDQEVIGYVCGDGCGGRGDGGYGGRGDGGYGGRGDVGCGGYGGCGDEGILAIALALVIVMVVVYFKRLRLVLRCAKAGSSWL